MTTLSMIILILFIILTYYFYLLQLLIFKIRRIYRIFGSGSSHKPYAQFMSQAAIFNDGSSIGLLRGATTRMASFFIQCIVVYVNVKH